MQKGQIYKIVHCEEPDTCLYIGSTVTTLKQRWCVHKVDSRRYNSKFNLHLREHGVDNFKMVPIDTVTFDNVSELRKVEERYRCELKPLLNTHSCYTGLSKKEYSKFYDKIYRKNHPEKIAAKNKRFYAKHKEKILNSRKVSIICPRCHACVRKPSLNRHQKTYKCQHIFAQRQCMKEQVV